MSNPGDLDTTFGTGGKVLTDIPGTTVDRGHGVVIQSDGKIVVAGTADFTVTADSEFLVIRYNTDGSLDSTFGTGGIVITSFTGNGTKGRGIAIDSNDKIVVVGITGTNSNFAIARYGTDGALDATFGTGGQVITDLVAASNIDNAYAVAVDSSNRILVGGDIDIGGGKDFVVARYLENGNLDTGDFGNPNGYVITDFGSGNDSAWSLIIRSDGKILAGGYAEISGTYNFAMALYNTDGSLDTSFGGGDGKVETLFGAGDYGTTMAVQSDGKIILGGYASIDSANRSTIARYSADGILDTTFGTNSGYTPNTLGSQSLGYGLAVDTTDRILFGGNVVLSGNNDFLMARYTANGALDTSFGTNGSVATSMGTASTPVASSAYIAIQLSDNKIVAAGYATMSGGDQVVALVRYIGDPSPPGPTPTPTPTPSPTLTSPWYLLSLNNNGVGVRKSTLFGAGGNGSGNQPGFIYNRYSAGNSGIGGQSTAVRRAKNRKAAFCGFTPCPTPQHARIIQNERVILKKNNGFFM
jgi:uncharacterized delta-60 repeat protein